MVKNLVAQANRMKKLHMKMYSSVSKSDQNQPHTNHHTFLITCVLFLLSVILSAELYGQVGLQTDNPDPSSVLDIVSSNKGILIPRVSLTNDLSDPSPVAAPATGLLIFNNGPTQPAGFYFWNGSKWEAVGGTSDFAEGWLTEGNDEIDAVNNYLGTNDSADLVIRTVANERMRINDKGQVMIGTVEPGDSEELFTVSADSGHESALNAYSDHTGIYSSGAKYGVITVSNDSTGFPVYSKNKSEDGYGGIFVGSNGSAYTLIDHSSGISSHGNDGIFTTGLDINEGIGIIAGGNNVQTLSTIPTGAGGAFTGHHGIYAHAIDRTEGTGVVGVGNDNENYLILRNGSGGAFTGFHGLLGYATDERDGTGVVGSGNSSGYYIMDGYGSGGAFTGEFVGVAGWADRNDNNSIGVLGQYYGGSGWSDGMGVKGIAYSGWGRGYGVYGQGNRYGVFANGNLGATGTKSFAIDHPLDPENKILKHYSIESPEVLNLYRGNEVLDAGGKAVIKLPDYFTAINTNFSYVLTAIGSKAPGLYIKQEIDDAGTFVVAGGNPGQKFSWVVYAERNDPYLQAYPESKAVEVEKTDDLKGRYLRPELYGKSKDKGMFYQEHNAKRKPERHNSNSRHVNLLPEKTSK